MNQFHRDLVTTAAQFCQTTHTETGDFAQTAAGQPITNGENQMTTILRLTAPIFSLIVSAALMNMIHTPPPPLLLPSTTSKKH